MPKEIFIALTLTLLMTGCGSAPAPAPASSPAPVEAPAEAPTDIPTKAPLPTETAMPEPTSDPSVFGSISVADAPVGFMLEPIAQVIFEAELQKRVEAGEIGGFQVEGLSIVPRGDGTFFAEIFYALQANASFWPEDIGTPGDDGWVHGKCTRFDFEVAEDGYYLKDKAICN